MNLQLKDGDTIKVQDKNKSMCDTCCSFWILNYCGKYEVDLKEMSINNCKRCFKCTEEAE